MDSTKTWVGKKHGTAVGKKRNVRHHPATLKDQRSAVLQHLASVVNGMKSSMICYHCDHQQQAWTSSVSC